MTGRGMRDVVRGEGHDFRMTTQRAAILEEVRAARGHLTAGEIFFGCIAGIHRSHTGRSIGRYTCLPSMG